MVLATSKVRYTVVLYTIVQYTVQYPRLRFLPHRRYGSAPEHRQKDQPSATKQAALLNTARAP